MDYKATCIHPASIPNATHLPALIFVRFGGVHSLLELVQGEHAIVVSIEFAHYVFTHAIHFLLFLDRIRLGCFVVHFLRLQSNERPVCLSTVLFRSPLSA